MQKTVSEVLKTWCFSYSEFWSTNGGEGTASLPGYAVDKHNDYWPIRQDSHLSALFEVFYNSGEIILLWFFESFILQFVITVGITLVDSVVKTYTCIITLKYINKWKQFQTRDNIFIKYNLNFLCNITMQYKSHKISVGETHAAREPQFAHCWSKPMVSYYLHKHHNRKWNRSSGRPIREITL